MFLSGATKLLAFDDTWWKLTALDYHYWTQPLPWWTSWYVHQLPSGFDRVSVAVTLLIELGAPFLVFFGRRGRAVAFVLLVGLQLAIAWTGNYGFFNLLTVVLCLALLDDRHLERFLPVRSERRLAGPGSRRLGEILRGGNWAAPLRVALAAVLVDGNGGELPVAVLDLSSGGCRMRAKWVLTNGAKVYLKVRHDKLPAEIIWVDGA